MCDIIDYNFVGKRDNSGTAIPFQPGRIPKMKTETFESSLNPIKLDENHGTAEDEWLLRQTLYRGYLISKGCRATAALAKKPMKIQKDCFELSKYLYFSWQAYVDLQSFKGHKPENDEKFILTSAPVLFHLEHNPSAHALISNQSLNLDGLDYQTLFNDVKNGPGVKLTEKLLTKLVQQARSHLKNFVTSEEKLKIEKILSDFL